MNSKPGHYIRNNPIAIVLLIAVLVRLIYLIFYITSPAWNQLLVDSLFHDRWALAIAGGDIIGHDAYFRAPLYIYILGGIYALFGHSLLAARIFGHLVGLVSIFITYKLTLKVFSKRAAIIAALIHAIYPIAIYFESELLVESFFTLLLTLSVLCFLNALTSNDRRGFFLTGIIIGLAAITRPVVMPLLPLYIIWIAWKFGKAKKTIVYASTLIAATALVIMPVTLRNVLVAHDLVTIASSGGINFYIGNNPDADGLSATLPPPLGANWQLSDIQYQAESASGHKLKPSEISDFWSKKGLSWIMHNKSDFGRLYIKKLYFCFNNFEVSNNRNLPLFFSQNPILRYIPLNFALIFSLAVIGLLCLTLTKKIDSDILFIILFGIIYLLMILFFFINARFRLPVLPFFFAFGGAGLLYIYELARQRQHYVRLASIILLGLIMFWLSKTNLYNIDRANIDSGLFNQANYYLFKSDRKKAISLYYQLLERDPAYPDANLNLGAAYFKEGRIDSALIFFEKELALSPQDAEVYSNLASYYLLKDSLDKALEYADKAILLKPYWVDGYMVKLRLLSRLNEIDKIESLLYQAQSNLGQNPRLLLDAGLIYSGSRLYDKAQGCLNEVLNVSPKAIESNEEAFAYNLEDFGITQIKAQAAYQLGYIYGINGNLEKSISMSSRAIALDSNLVEAYINLINGHSAKGDRNRARQILAIAVRRFPGNPVLQRFSESLK